MDKAARFGGHGGPRGRREEFRRFGFGPPPPFGGGPFGGGRGRRRRGDVRIALLMLLAEEPSNGYGLMQTIEERSGGRWRPSPGSVYPALSQLEDEGFVRGVQQDSGRMFEITDAGRAHLEQRGHTTPPWEEPDEMPGGNSLQELSGLMIGIGKAAWQVASEGDEQQWSEASRILGDARRSLYRILAEESDEPEAPSTDM
jgi:DNA-binding PadR family transcriptional regulator